MPRTRLSAAILTVSTIAALAMCIATPALAATTFTFPTFNVVAHDTNDIQSVPLNGAPSGRTFNGFTVGFDWTAGETIPQSNEASWAMVNQPPPQNAGSVFYEDPGTAPNAKFDGNPIHLSWGGPLDLNYVGGDPLHFWYVQSFGDSTANWNNIDVTLYSFSPLTSGFSGNTTGKPTWRRPNTTSGLSNVGSAVPYEAVPFTVDQSGPYTITTNTAGDIPAFDGYLGIYDGSFSATDQLSNILALDDDGPNGSADSQVNVALTAGHNYFLVQSGFANGDAGAWSATFSGPGVAIVPEPAMAIAAASILFWLRRHERRRECAQSSMSK